MASEYLVSKVPSVGLGINSRTDRNHQLFVTRKRAASSTKSLSVLFSYIHVYGSAHRVSDSLAMLLITINATVFLVYRTFNKVVILIITLGSRDTRIDRY